MRVVAVIQARMGSTRLPGKVLQEIAGEPMVAHVVRRTAAIEGVDEVAVAIPDTPEDDILDDVLTRLGIRSVRGSAADVLSRYRLALDTLRGDAVVRVTADCPLLSPRVSGRVVRDFLRGDADYCSNTLERTWPRGMDTEVISGDVLREADAEARTEVEREHVTPFVWRRPERYRLRSVTDAVDRSGVRLTVDTEEDLRLVRALFSELGAVDVELTDLLEVLDRRPDLRALNASVEQKPLS